MPAPFPTDASPYASEFYLETNIVGYTGDLSNNPTIYFETQLYFGHITQSHDVIANVGRQLVEEKQMYYQAADLNTGFLEEWNNGKLVHDSRGKFLKAGPRLQTKLGLAILRFQNLKPIIKEQLAAFGRIDKIINS